jgi:predicted transcriptional regulator
MLAPTRPSGRPRTKEKTFSPRTTEIRTLTDKIFAFVKDNEGCCAHDVAAAIEAGHERTKDMLNRSLKLGLVSRKKVRHKTTWHYVYALAGVYVDVPETPMAQDLCEYIKANPGCVRNQIVSAVNKHKKSDVTAQTLCTLVKKGRVYTIGNATGVRYYIETPNAEITGLSG